MNIKEEKQAKINEITEKMKKAQSIVLTAYSGITVEDDTALRKQLREAKVEYHVYKNTYTARAAKEAGYEDMEKYLAGPIAVAFSYDDPTAPARLLAGFAKDHEMIKLKAGVVQGQFYDEKKINEIASIPSREVLIGKLLGSLRAPLSKFVYVINAVKENKEKESANA